MAKQKLTNRQAQANRTKNKIYNVSIDLMVEKGFNNVTIEEISKKAGVSVGAFYHYYKSKDDIFFEIYKKSDEYYRNEVACHLKNDKLNSLDQIVLYFKFYARYNNGRGLENVSQLYNTKNKHFIDKSRYMITLLREIIQNGQEKKEITTEMSADSINDCLFIVGRGVVIDWCLHDAGYDLEEMMEMMIRRLVVTFKANP